MKLVEFSFRREVGWILIFSLGPGVGAIVAALIYTPIR